MPGCIIVVNELVCMYMTQAEKANQDKNGSNNIENRLTMSNGFMTQTGKAVSEFQTFQSTEAFPE